MESKGAEPPAALPTPGGGSGPADAQALPRAHPLPEPPLEQVSLGYMTVHFRRAHAGRRGAGRLRMPAGLKLLNPVALATRCGAILAPAPDLGGGGVCGPSPAQSGAALDLKVPPHGAAPDSFYPSGCDRQTPPTRLRSRWPRPSPAPRSLLRPPEPCLPTPDLCASVPRPETQFPPPDWADAGTT